MSYQTEIRDGKEVVVISTEDFNKQFKKKRVSAKQKIMEENKIDLKYLKRIQYKKKEGTFSFKIMGIPNVDALKQLVKLDEVINGFGEYNMNSVNMDLLKAKILKEMAESAEKTQNPKN